MIDNYTSFTKSNKIPKDVIYNINDVLQSTIDNGFIFNMSFNSGSRNHNLVYKLSEKNYKYINGIIDYIFIVNDQSDYFNIDDINTEILMINSFLNEFDVEFSLEFRTVDKTRKYNAPRNNWFNYTQLLQMNPIPNISYCKYRLDAVIT